MKEHPIFTPKGLCIAARGWPGSAGLPWVIDGPSCSSTPTGLCPWNRGRSRWSNPFRVKEQSSNRVTQGSVAATQPWAVFRHPFGVKVNMSRRDFCRATVATLAAAPLARAAEPFRLRYVLASCMYGTMGLSTILAHLRETGAEVIDLWPRPHGDQREQVEEMGYERFAELLHEHGVTLGVSTRYDLGPERAHEEIPFLKKLGGSVLVTGSGGPKGLMGDELKSAVRKLVDRLGPAAAAAREAGVTLAIENHASSLLDSPDSMRWFAQFSAGTPHLGLAFAPHHLPQDASFQASLIEQLGPAVKFFYAQQLGKGSKQAMPKADELLQMPGRGPLDFAPVVAALRKINFQGYAEIFMHPFPRGIPILDTAELVTQEINRSRAYLDKCIKNG